jgi:hypothetical protein
MELLGFESVGIVAVLLVVQGKVGQGKVERTRRGKAR